MKKILGLAVVIFIPISLFAQNLHIQPTPQNISVSGKVADVPESYRFYGGETADVEAVKLMRLIFSVEDESTSGQVCIYIGERGDRAVRKFASKIPDCPEGYYLRVDGKNIVIAGADERGTYYGVRTFLQLMSHGKLPEVEITDYPDVRFRGVVEGFYGIPWSFEARKRQLEFYGKHKMNTYIYGPKDDPYHSAPNWRKPYPPEEAEHIRSLVEMAAVHKVDFVWAIHPGKDIQWTEEDRDALLGKFEAMYDFGVRAFAVFFDDISGKGTDPVRQAELMNYLDEYFVKVKKDVRPLIVCPTEYNRNWVKPERGYLEHLGKTLNNDIQIMWTGDYVVCDITSEGLDWVNSRIRRPAYIWWNYPVNDYARDHIVMGEVDRLDKSIVSSLMSGFVSNPMEQAEASKVALYAIASYAWNLEAYDSEVAWEDALRELMPQDYQFLRVFAEHNADFGENINNYRREESRKIKPVAEAFLQNYQKAFFSEELGKKLTEEFEQIETSADMLMGSKDNNALVSEIYPWLLQFKSIGELGQQVLAMARMVNSLQQLDKDLFLRMYRRVVALRDIRIKTGIACNDNSDCPGIKTASCVLEPFICELFKLSVERFNENFDQKLETNLVFDYKDYLKD